MPRYILKGIMFINIFILFLQRQRRWIQSRGVAASVAAGDQNNPQIPNPVDHSAIPIGDADSIAGNNLPNTPDLPPQYDQLSIQGIYPQNW